MFDLPSFNPVLGFLSVATKSPAALRPVLDAFQSRAGFSLRRDAPTDLNHGLGIRFNPVLGFLSVATDGERYRLVVENRFQSRAGFSLRRDEAIRIFPLTFLHLVSIPCWVFSPSRPARVFSPEGDGEFQSRAGFSLRRDA